MARRADKPTKPRWHNYWRESSRPLVSLVFVAPMLAIYEFGIITLGPEAIRNGAEAWLRQALGAIGFGQYLLLPAMTCFLLLAWHHTTHDRWRFPPGVLFGMLIESATIGLLMVLAASSLFRASRVEISALPGARLMLHQAAETTPADNQTEPQPASPSTDAPTADDPAARPQPALSNAATQLVARLIGYVGAGLYEELLFRLVLLSAVGMLFRMAGGGDRASLIVAIVVTSLIFSAAHYQLFTSHGDVFHWNTFVFRFFAGVFFSLLFVLRGFGVTSGAHAAYDIFAELATRL